MIAASEPLEFIPRGRPAVEEHPGPLTTKEQLNVNSEHLIVHRLQNVSLSDSDDEFNEFWNIREIYHGLNDERQEMSAINHNNNNNNNNNSMYCTNEVMVNSEDELYVKGYTAVWTRGLIDSSDNQSIPKICLTCDTPIRHAFFCTDTFLNAKRSEKIVYKTNSTNSDNIGIDKHLNGICLIDSTSLKVYVNSGEEYLASLDFPISKVWTTKFGILIEKSPVRLDMKNSASIALPRIFSLAHPLDDICPVLLKLHNNAIDCLHENDFNVIYANDQHELVLLYNHKLGKHFIAKLREVTADELAACTHESMVETTDYNQSSQYGFRNSTHNTFKNSGIGKSINLSGHQVLTPKFGTGNITGYNIVAGPTTSSSPAVTQQNRTTHTPLAFLQSSLGSHQSFSVNDMRKTDIYYPAKPIVPKLILDTMWTESQTQTTTSLYGEKANNGFFHYDLIGQCYLCYLLMRSAQLCLIAINKTDKYEYTFDNLKCIPAKDAICINKIGMIAVLDINGSIILYTGPVKIGKLHISGMLSNEPSSSNLRKSFNSFPRRSSLLPSVRTSTSIDPKFDDELHLISPVHPVIHTKFGIRNNYNCSGLRDPAGNRLTLIYTDSKMYRISIPLLCECPYVSRCLMALRQILNKEHSIEFLIKWYSIRNAPGSQDFNSEREFLTFKKVLNDLLGRPPIIDTIALNISSEKAKKRRVSDSATDTDWKNLVNLLNKINRIGTAQVTSPDDPNNAKKMEQINSNALLYGQTPLIFFAFHLLYEDMKLNVMFKPYLKFMSEILYEIALDLQLENYCLHYSLDFPELININTCSYYNNGDLKTFLQTPYLTETDTTVPNIFQCICTMIMDNRQPMANKQYPIIQHLNQLSKNVIDIIALIVCTTTKKSAACNGLTKHFYKLITIDSDRNKNMEIDQEHTDKLINEPATVNQHKYAIGLNTINAIALKVVYKLIDLKITRHDLENLPTAVYFFIADIIERVREMPPIECGAAAYDLLLRPELLEQVIDDTEDKGKYIFDININYLNNIHKEHSLSERNKSAKYNSDGDLKCSKNSTSSAKKDVLPEENEDGMENVDTQLLHLRFPKDLRVLEVRRMLASAYSVSIDIVQSAGVNDHEFLQEQEKELYNICARTMALPAGRGMFTLRTYIPLPTESFTIPKLCLTGKEPKKGATIQLSNHLEIPANMNLWPLFHNGVAAGLQILPEAKDIDTAWIVYNKPKLQTESSAEHAGFLLALGLNEHLKTLSFMSIYDYLVKCDEMTSVGLILGVSVANRGTMSSTMTKLLSVHIEALLPATELELDIPQNVQVAAIMGIGFVYQGTAKRHIAEILLQEIGRPPGPEMDNCVERESYALTAGLSLGLVTLGQGDSQIGLSDLQLSDTLLYYMIGGTKRPLTGTQKEKYRFPSFQVREGNVVNVDVTAPGAILALGLMYFNTGNYAIANWMKPPDTQYLLDVIRPDILLLRTIARNLILWNDIEATEQWLDDQFPKSLAFDLKRGPADMDDSDVDNEAICQAYCNIIAGSTFCIGLRHTGTNDETVCDLLYRIFDKFLNMNGKYVGEHAGKSTVESCLLLILLAMSLVCAGSGNLKVIRICRMLRERLGPTNSQVTYGSHMAVHMALGFCFLGAGRYTLSRTPQSIAAIICSLFPKFPTHSNDNRYHLQAFRHLYVLAIEPRLFITRDIISGKLCSINVSYIEIGTDVLKKLSMAPCILPELNSIKSIIIDDVGYWPISFERERNWNQLLKIVSKSQCIEIKQKAGYFGVVNKDNKKIKNDKQAPVTYVNYESWKADLSIMVQYSKDPKVQNFIYKFLSNPETECASNRTFEKQLRYLLSIQFYNCLSNDTMHALPIYMDLLVPLKENTMTTYDVWQYKIMLSVLSRSQINVLLSRDNLYSLIHSFRIKSWSILNNESTVKYLKQYLFSTNILYLQELTTTSNQLNYKDLYDIIQLIVFFDLPVNVLNLIDLGNGRDQLNYIRLMYELGKLKIPSAAIDLISKILNFNSSNNSNNNNNNQLSIQSHSRNNLK